MMASAIKRPPGGTRIRGSGRSGRAVEAELLEDLGMRYDHVQVVAAQDLQKHVLISLGQQCHAPITAMGQAWPTARPALRHAHADTWEGWRHGDGTKYGRAPFSERPKLHLPVK